MTLQARTRLCNTVFQLIDSWKEQHRAEAEIDAAASSGKPDVGAGRHSSNGVGAAATSGRGGLSGVAPGSFLDLMLGQRQGGERGSGGKKAEGEEGVEHAPLTDEQVAGQVRSRDGWCNGEQDGAVQRPLGLAISPCPHVQASEATPHHTAASHACRCSCSSWRATRRPPTPWPLLCTALQPTPRVLQPTG